MIAHLRGRERALASFGLTGRRAEWIALARLHGGVFARSPKRLMRRVGPERPRLRRTHLSDAAKAGEPAYPGYTQGLARDSARPSFLAGAGIETQGSLGSGLSERERCYRPAAQWSSGMIASLRRRER